MSFLTHDALLGYYNEKCIVPVFRHCGVCGRILYYTCSELCRPVIAVFPWFCGQNVMTPYDKQFEYTVWQ